MMPEAGRAGSSGKMPSTHPKTSRIKPSHDPRLEEEAKGNGGREGARTPDLRVANAALFQLSYTPFGSLILAWRPGPPSPYGQTRLTYSIYKQMTGDSMERELRAWLNAHRERLPSGMEVEEVQLLTGRQLKTARRQRKSAAKSSPKADALFIVLRPAAPASEENGLEAHITQLLKALRDAERTPGHSFVVLKWFRDSYLPQRDWAWAQSAEERDRVLRAATGRGWVGISKVPNPRHPSFETSAIRVQSEWPEVRRILGDEAPLGWGFPRIKVKGEPVSETLARMRDED